MERVQEENGLLIPLDHYTNDFGLIDFMDEANLDQFIDLIRGENEPQSIADFSSQDYENSFDGHFLPPVELFDLDVAAGYVASNGNADFSMENACQKAADREEIMDGEESSAITMTTTTMPDTPTTMKKKSNKVDRSRTLISERRRRGRMKEKLYALRSLVPNITKMDKASIVGDAVLYVQGLQTQAKKLKSEISSLESSLKERDKYNGRSTTQNSKKIDAANFCPISKKIFKVDVFQVEERGFYIRIVSNKGRGVAVSLYKALESLGTFHVQSSNLAASAENYVFTFTLHIMEPEMDVNLPNLKLWIASIFLNQGFEFEASQSA
ncbi:hypothetical protein CDL12_17822 [Handroanthus impetiginosus]|uniref:BHLH domain-containing protein n=1 Tax=Handroanthus impetiginosus TaxID=429701 RepID=A0A2G9GWF6_9LAMI|nr:hypothetical protein CDL12_17822 [Handroanthus impetiginosus]